MRIIHTDDYEAMSKKSAAIVASQIILKPDSVLGLATGSTPLEMYKELIRLHREVGLDFSEVITYNLDEYVGIPRNDENSYHYYMYENFFNHINIKGENINLPDGNALDSERECIEFENKIRASGGLDLQVLGIGNNGHIGFNEPDLKFEATTHLVTLDEETRIANSRFFESIDKVPTLAISMGIRTIMNAKKILLLASGASKADVVHKAIYGGITPNVPASILQLHPDVTIIVDKEAGSLL